MVIATATIRSVRSWSHFDTTKNSKEEFFLLIKYVYGHILGKYQRSLVPLVQKSIKHKIKTIKHKMKNRFYKSIRVIL